MNYKFDFSDHKKKVVIVGGFGWHDIGDEAMPRADIINFRKQLPDLEIVMLSPNPEYTTTYHHERAIADLYCYLYKVLPWPFRKIQALLQKLPRWIIKQETNQEIWVIFRWVMFIIATEFQKVGIRLPISKTARTILDELTSADLLFNVGGGNINSLIRSELYQKTLVHLCARILDVPSILSGQTIGPFLNKKDGLLVRLALTKIDTITLRDKEVSRKRLADIGITGNNIFDTADDAISLPALPKDASMTLIRKISGKKWNRDSIPLLVALNANGYALGMGKEGNASRSHEVELLAGIVDRLIEQHDAYILLVPTDYGNSSDDRPLLGQIQSAMKYKDKTVCVKDEYDDITLKGLIGLADLAMGSRYHFNVFAASMGVPCIGFASGVYQMTKLQGLMNLYDMPDCFVNKGIDSLESDELWKIIERVIHNRFQIRAKLTEKTSILNERSLLTIERAIEILTRKSL